MRRGANFESESIPLLLGLPLFPLLLLYVFFFFLQIDVSLANEVLLVFLHPS